jgi:hypothetical protein
MARVTLKLVKNNVTPSLKRIQNSLDKVPTEAYNFFKNITPIRSGNARRKTKLQRDTIKAEYEYATELDSGKSRQAPIGMSKPTEDFITSRVKAIMRRK